MVILFRNDSDGWVCKILHFTNISMIYFITGLGNP